jgi:hypothetical protein
MKCQHGVLRTKQAHSFWLRPFSQERKLTWVEYLPLVILGILMAGLFLHIMLSQIAH